MKTLKLFSNLSIILFLLLNTSCSIFKSKNYDITYDNNNITITIPMPTFGLVNINDVDYDGFTLEDIEKELYDDFTCLFSTKSGTYNIELVIKYRDMYGKFSSGSTIELGSIDAEEVRKYESYKYFRGTISNKISNAVFKSINAK
jgi:hypothetical protein